MKGINEGKQLVRGGRVWQCMVVFGEILGHVLFKSGHDRPDASHLPGIGVLQSLDAFAEFVHVLNYFARDDGVASLYFLLDAALLVLPSRNDAAVLVFVYGGIISAFRGGIISILSL